MSLSLVLIFGLLLLFEECTGESCLAYYSSSGSTSYYMHCSYKCCGTSYSRYCCSDNSAANIAGAVVGCLVVTAVLVVVTVVACIQYKKAKIKRSTMDDSPEADEAVVQHYEATGQLPSHIIMDPPPKPGMQPSHNPSHIPRAEVYPSTAINYEVTREDTVIEPCPEDA